jgi:signal peptidase I
VDTRRYIVGATPRRTAVRILVLIALSIVTFTWVLIPIRGYGISMQPAYEPGSFNFANRIAYAIRSPRRGDVVAIRFAGGRVLLVKRIVGLPGERVEIREGIVHANGEPLDEPYVRLRRPWNVEEVALGSREYFVIGDNRSMGERDHDFGRVDRSRIVGPLVF